MKKLHRKLLNERKTANKLACVSYRNSEGKPYYTHHYTEDREIYWCDIVFRKGKKVYNCTVQGLSSAISDAVLEALYKHPEYKTLPKRDTPIGRVHRYNERLALEKRIHEEGVVVKAGIKVQRGYRYGTGLEVVFTTDTFREDDILDLIKCWDGTNHNWGELNSKDFPFDNSCHVNAIKF